MAGEGNIFDGITAMDGVGFEASNVSRANPNQRCPMSNQPSYHQNIEVLGTWAPVLFSVGAGILIFIYIIYFDIVRHLLKNIPSRFKSSSLVVVTVYPIMALVSYIAIVVPRFQLLAEAIIMFTWMTALYQLFVLLVSYSGGETCIVKQVEAGVMDLQVAPLCCLPCCCFPKLDLNKSRLRIPRLLILQLSLVQSCVYLCLLVIFAEDERKYQDVYLYFQSLAIPSIFSAVWGMTIALRMLAPSLAAHHMYGKYASLQLVLVFTKVQGTVARVAVAFMEKPCADDPAPSVLSYLICNSVFLLELAGLVVLARMFHKRPMPEDVIHPLSLQEKRTISIVHNQNNNYSSTKEGIDNVAFT